METMFYIAAILAFAPAIAMMYILLKKYTFPATEYPYFSDPSFFIQFTVGLVAGTIMFLVYTYVMDSVVSVILYSVIQVLAAVVVLNLKRYRGKSDSIFYGFGFGLGAGCTTATGFIYYVSTASAQLGGSVGVFEYALLFVMALSMIFQYSSVGITVGEGIARHNPMQFAFQAMIYNLVYWVLFTIMLFNSDSTLMYLMVAACFVVSAFYLYYAYVKEMGCLAREVSDMNKKGKKNRS